MKSGFPLLPVLFLGASAVGHAFSLDIARGEVTEFGQGPRSVFVPGYGEIGFESGLDGVLVVDSAYASTNQFDMPTPSSGSTAEQSVVPVASSRDPGIVEISNRRAQDLPAPLLQSVDTAIQKPPGDWIAVPETASATLGIIGTLMLLLRKRSNTEPSMEGKP